MGKSIKVNYILNLINTATSLLFPIITFPYASRVLLADGIGQVNFYTSIITYISLLTCVGIPLYAVREIARVRDNKHECAKNSAEILLLHAILSVIGYVIVVVMVLTVTKIQSNIPLFLILSTSIFLTAIGAEWFYQGIEDFKYITIRGVLVKLISVGLLFLLVKTKEDILWYGLYTVIGSIGGNLFNFYRLHLKIDFRGLKFAELNPFIHLKPALRIFVLNLIVSIYANLNIVMLGFLKDDSAVGYYTGGVKLTMCVLSIVTALQTVAIPKLSNLIANDDKSEFSRLAQKLYDFVLMITIPMAVGLTVLATPIINLFCGPSYEPSILVLQLMATVVIWSGLSGVLGVQILYAQGKESVVIVSAFVGAVINLGLNFMVIPEYAQNGASVAIVIAELAVTITMITIGKKYLPIKILNKKMGHYIIASILVAVSSKIIMIELVAHQLLAFLIAVVAGILIYVVYLYCIKEAILIETLKLILRNHERN